MGTTEVTTTMGQCDHCHRVWPLGSMYPAKGFRVIVPVGARVSNLPDGFDLCSRNCVVEWAKGWPNEAESARVPR